MNQRMEKGKRSQMMKSKSRSKNNRMKIKRKKRSIVQEAPVLTYKNIWVA